MKIPKKIIKEMEMIKDINLNSPRPDSLGEWLEAKRLGDIFYKNLEKYPELKDMGFEEEDVIFYDE